MYQENKKNTVILDVADFDDITPQLKTYEIDYSVWEQNKYSVEIEAYSKEEAEAKFYETYEGEGKPYRKDEEIIAIRETSSSSTNESLERKNIKKTVTSKKNVKLTEDDLTVRVEYRDKKFPSNKDDFKLYRINFADELGWEP